MATRFFKLETEICIPVRLTYAVNDEGEIAEMPELESHCPAITGYDIAYDELPVGDRTSLGRIIAAHYKRETHS